MLTIEAHLAQYTIWMPDHCTCCQEQRLLCDPSNMQGFKRVQPLQCLLTDAVAAASGHMQMWCRLRANQAGQLPAIRHRLAFRLVVQAANSAAMKGSCLAPHHKPEYHLPARQQHSDSTVLVGLVTHGHEITR